MDNIQELLEVLDEISEMNDQECERLETQFKIKCPTKNALNMMNEN